MSSITDFFQFCKSFGKVDQSTLIQDCPTNLNTWIIRLYLNLPIRSFLYCTVVGDLFPAYAARRNNSLRHVVCKIVPRNIISFNIILIWDYISYEGKVVFIFCILIWPGFVHGAADHWLQMKFPIHVKTKPI